MCSATVWEDRDENDVLDCLEEACLNVGYDSVYNRHKYDKPHEEGIDIECQKFGETTVLQAKVKPIKNDIKQLRKLSCYAANRRIYVYIRNPSISFKKEMESLEHTVEFWNFRHLHDFLITYRSLLYLRFLFLSSHMVKNITKVLHDIFSCCEVGPRKLESLYLNDWWTFKDRTVKIHASLQYLESFWKDHIFTIDRHDVNEFKRIFESILFSFKLIAELSSKDLVNLVLKIKKNNPGLFSEYVNVVLGRSNWIGMGRVKREIRNEKEVIKTIDAWVVPPPRRDTEYSQIHYYLENLKNVSKAIEDGVDWLFQDYLESQNLPTY